MRHPRPVQKKKKKKKNISNPGFTDKSWMVFKIHPFFPRQACKIQQKPFAASSSSLHGTGIGRAAVAVDAASGLLWEFTPQEGFRLVCLYNLAIRIAPHKEEMKNQAEYGHVATNA